MKVKSLSRVRLYTTPWTAAHQAPLSMGFSRQEYWNGLPLPSPSYAAVTNKVKVRVTQLCLTLCNPMDYTVHGIIQVRTLEWVRFPSSGDLPNPGIEPRSPILQADPLPAEPPGKPKNTGVGSLSLLQRIFLTQELNWGLLHCRQIPYQLSYWGSPVTNKTHLLITNVCFSFT